MAAGCPTDRVSLIALGAGTRIMTQPTGFRCEACLTPETEWRTSCDQSPWALSGGDYFEAVPCPTEFQEGAKRVEEAIDRDAVILMVFGGIGVFAGSVLLIRTRRGGARSASDAGTGAETPP